MPAYESMENAVINALMDMYKERGMPISAAGVASRVGCTSSTALRHLKSNQEKFQSKPGLYGEWFFTPREDDE